MAFSLKNLFGGAVEKVVTSVGNALDKNITNKEEKMAAEKAITEVLLEHQSNLDNEVTERLKADMTSDSWLSKNIRPMTLIFVTAIVTGITLFDGNIGDFAINTSYLPIWQSAFVTIFMFYFGSRGLEKIAQNVNLNKK